MTTATKKFLRIRAKKPVGGYILLTVQQLCLLWWLYRTRAIQLLDFRVWCAAHEMVARRCQLAPGQVPAYTTRELHTLVGGRGGGHLRASLHRLDHLGLLTWSPPTLSFATSPHDLRHIEDFSGFAQMFDAVPNHHRRVPVPRQALRLIAGGVRPAVIATILGTCFRCLYYHARETFPVESGGWMKSSWIGGVFQVNLRNVKAARKHLTDLGWLLTFTAPQRIQNRWGTYAQVSLTWERPPRDSVRDAALISVPETLPEAVAPSAPSLAFSTPQLPPPPAFSTPQLPPPPAFSTPQLPPLLLHSQLLQESKHQESTLEAKNPQHKEPACGGQQETGVQNKTPAKKTILTPPTLRHIIPEDLESTERLLALFAEAQDLQLVGSNASARLAFVAAAEHATVIGTANSCGLFATLVRKQLWHFATAGDEDTAHARLKHYLYGTPCPEARTLPTAINTPQPLSDDALTVQSLRHNLARAGFSGDIFLLLHREYPEWTRERWEMACTELVAAAAARRTTPALTRLGTVTAAMLEDNA